MASYISSDARQGYIELLPHFKPFTTAITGVVL